VIEQEPDREARSRRGPRLLIADDDDLIQAKLRAQLEAEFDIVGGAFDGDEAIELADLHQPDAAIIDVKMPFGGGLHATRGIRERSPHTAILALSADEDAAIVLGMLQAGAMGYVNKSTNGHELTRLLRSAIDGHAEMYPSRLRQLLIADDDELIQVALDAQLSRSFEIIGGAHDADEAIALAELRRPQVALIDVEMPGGGGLRATREIHERSPHTAIVALSSEEDAEVVLAMLQAGAMAYVRKGTASHELADCLRSAIVAHAKLFPG
jgi:DNA-binding NarL/FixJ family response regulator